MTPARFEHAVPVIERPQTRTLDSTATGIGGLICIIINVVSYERFGRRHLFSCSEGGPGCFSADWVTACIKLRYIKHPKNRHYQDGQIIMSGGFGMGGTCKILMHPYGDISELYNRNLYS